MSASEFSPDPHSPLDPESQWEDFQNRRAFEESDERTKQHLIQHGQGRAVVEGDMPFQGGALGQNTEVLRQEEPEEEGQQIRAEQYLDTPPMRLGNIALRTVFKASPALRIAQNMHRRLNR